MSEETLRLTAELRDDVTARLAKIQQALIGQIFFLIFADERNIPVDMQADCG
jgi:hypothetical protein